MVTEPGQHLTRQMVLDAIEKVRNQPVTVCVGSNQHVVHPKDTGWVNCAACFRVVWAGPGAPS